MVEIVWTEEAERWMKSIHDYTAADSPAAAKRILRGIRKKTALLKRHPRLGWKHERITNREVRILLQGNYRIAYWIRSEDRIEILGVYHAAMDMEKRLK